MFKYDYTINHDHYYHRRNPITLQKVKKLKYESNYYYRRSMEEEYDKWLDGETVVEEENHEIIEFKHKEDYTSK